MELDYLDVSAIICVYNGDPWLPEVFERLENMRLERFELIFVNDGSIDSSLQMMRNFQSLHRSVKILVNTENVGLSESRNRGVAAATRKFVWIGDVDDQWQHDILDVLYNAVRLSGADAAICGAALIRQGRAVGIIGGKMKSANVTGGQAVVLALQGKIRGYTWNKLVTRRLLDRVPFAPVKMFTDFSAIITILSECRQIVLLDEVLYSHHANVGSLSRGLYTDVAALKSCLVTAIQLSANMPDRDQRRELEVYFEAWFFLIPLASASAGGNVVEPFKSEGLAIVRSRLRENGLRPLLRYSSSTWIRSILLVILGRHYRASYLAFRSLLVKSHRTRRVIRAAFLGRRKFP